MDDETYRRIAQHQTDVINAWGDARDLERSAANWPDAEEIVAQANEAVSALDTLNNTLDRYLEGR
jgi:hypothetical protein